jgi:hypothetical protein
MIMRRFASWFAVLLACGGSKNNNAADAPAVDAGPCPDQHGAYTIALSGQGCGDLNANAPECIAQSSCHITLTSTVPAGPAGLNGMTQLGMDGSFTMGAIMEGTSNRTGCVGAWTASTSTLTVDCGGVGTSQSCRATLTRTSKTCP